MEMGRANPQGTFPAGRSGGSARARLGARIAAGIPLAIFAGRIFDSCSISPRQWRTIFPSIPISIGRSKYCERFSYPRRTEEVEASGENVFPLAHPDASRGER